MHYLITNYITIQYIKVLGLILIFFNGYSRANFDVNVVGLLGIETTAPLIGTTIVDVLRENVAINLIPSRRLEGGIIQTQFLKDLPFKPESISLNHPNLAPISLLTDVLAYKNQPIYKRVPDSRIKLAYSMFEADWLPSRWPTILNDNFDAVIVPDEYLVSVYKRSGVKIPTFVIPFPIYIEDLLELSSPKHASGTFTFGVSAGFDERKNYILLLNAFAREFRNNRNVTLKIHGSWGDVRPILEKIKKLNLTNVSIITKKLTRKEYVEFIESLDCYVFLSGGEGYSITPRDALAAKRPVILSDHGVHHEMCNLPSVIGVPTAFIKKAYFEQMGEYAGNFRYCRLEDVANALRKMYTNFNSYRSKTAEGRKFAARFVRSTLAPYFVTLIKPASVQLADEDKISGNIIFTKSEKLVNKYNSLKI